jgi:hypothetical protein
VRYGDKQVSKMIKIYAFLTQAFPTWMSLWITFSHHVSAKLGTILGTISAYTHALNDHILNISKVHILARNMNPIAIAIDPSILT